MTYQLGRGRIAAAVHSHGASKAMHLGMRRMIYEYVSGAHNYYCPGP